MEREHGSAVATASAKGDSPPPPSPEHAPAITVEVIASLDRLQALEPEWDELYELRAEAGPGVSWEWCYHWWRHYGAGHRLQVLAVRDPQHLLLGLVPLMQLSGRWYQAREFRYLGDYGKGGAGDLEFLLRPGYDTLVLDAVSARLDQAADWDRLRLTRFRVESDGLWRFCQHAVARGLRAELRFHSWTVYMAMEGSFEDYLRTLSKHRRTYIRHWLRRLAAAHQVEFRLATEAEEIRDTVDWLVRHRRERVRRQGRWSWFDQPQYPQFLKDVCVATAGKGRLRLFRLSLDGSLAGCMLGMAAGDTVVLYSYAYDPAHTAMRVPDALISNTIKWCLEAGARVIEFGRGDTPHKAHYMKCLHPVAKLDLYRPQPRSLFAEAVAHAAFPLWYGAQALLPRRLITAVGRRVYRDTTPKARGQGDQEAA